MRWICRCIPRSNGSRKKKLVMGCLSAIKQRAAVLPLALAEWRSDPRSGHLEFANEKLTLTHEGNGRARVLSRVIRS